VRPPFWLFLGVILALAVPAVYVLSRGRPRRAPWPFRFAWLAAVAVLSFPVLVVLHNAVGALLGIEEPVFFFLALAAVPLFVVCVIGALVSSLYPRRSHP
jgi:hypothetical protein